MAKSPRRRIVDFAVRALPDSIEGDVRRVLGLEVKRAPSVVRRSAPKALPAPPKVLALPAPGPGLPSFAAKPRGGQFYPDTNLTHLDAQAAGYKLDNYTDQNGVDRYQVIRPEGSPVSGYVASSPEMGWQLANTHFENDRPFSNFSPENAARMARENYGLIQYNEVGDPEPQAQFGDWLERALAKYYKTDFGSPNDPLRELAERGLHYDPEMTPERWQQEVNNVLMEDPIGYFTVPRHESEIQSNLAGRPSSRNGFTFFGANDPAGQGALMQAAPWLRKQPATDMLYGIRGALDLGHFTDEFYNALRARDAGLPMDLAVRPESLDRMTFAQAAERVGRINQFRAKEMERAALSALDSPAVQTFKEYADDNPMGLRWTELKVPETKPSPDWGWEDIGGGRYRDPSGVLFSADKERPGVFKNEQEDDYWHLPADKNPRKALEDALKYEGDTMGHCVGGYCPDVMEGRSRIFSLRDAKGEPHVTIETSPRPMVMSDLVKHLGGDETLADDYLTQGFQAREAGDTDKSPLAFALEAAGVPQGQDIIQIKGKQNRAPKDDYLPFVQDFVKSGQWANVGDLSNTGLVRLPDGRYLTHDQMDEIIRNEGLDDMYQSYDFDARQFPRDPAYMDPEDWEQFQTYFQGYAIGGRVDADRCFCHNPLSVKKGKR